MNKEINCPNCNQRIKILDTIGYDLYLENLKKEEREIERQKEIIRQLDIKNLELTSILKEVREYIEKNLAKDDNGCGCWWYSFEYYVNAKKELLEILDKVNNKTNEAMPVEELEKYEPKNMAELEYQEWFWEDNE